MRCTLDSSVTADDKLNRNLGPQLPFIVSLAWLP